MLVQDAAELIAAGIQEDGKRTILGVTVEIGEHELHWRSFLEELLQRALTGVRMISSDDHAVLRAARKAVFGGIPWQRYQFHLQQIAAAHVPKVEMRSQITRAIRVILDAPDNRAVLETLRFTIANYETVAPKLVWWMETAIPESLSVMLLLPDIRK